ncbi:MULTISPECIES: hypothetical protein [Actinomadura]|uniref:hypothetical protein n=1 Tax=Actinomadura sp. NPDC000929 TaxID=3154517 RepID=UPI00339173AC
MGDDAVQQARTVRFVLDESSVQAVYPLPGGGNYAHVLPHITLDRSVLPWERVVSRSGAGAAPWLALLVFGEGELPGDRAASGVTATRIVDELLHPAEPGTIGPDLKQVPAGEACRTIDVPTAVFTAVAPAQDERWYAAHMRGIAAPVLRHDGEILTDGEYAVVTAGRFPRTAGSYAVHLVSLEGFSLGHLPAGTTQVRLASLRSWSFICHPDGGFDLPRLLDNPLIPSPGPSAEPSDQDMREMRDRGHVSVRLSTLSGEPTYAWYRGPFTPLAAPDNPAFPCPLQADQPTADHALIYEAEHGLFDVSYATAWTLGRSIALAHPDYCAQIVQARERLADRAADLGVTSAVPPAGHDLTPADPEAARAQKILADLADQYGPSLAARLGELALLGDIPLPALVPGPDLLPAESLRLFYIDTAWITALQAGAADIGIHTGLDAPLAPYLRQAATRAARTRPPAAAALLNSARLPAWPELGFTATRDGRPLTPLRSSHLAPDMLLVLFDAVPDAIAIREPGQGIHFGLTTADDPTGLFRLGGLTTGQDTPPNHPTAPA